MNNRKWVAISDFSYIARVAFAQQLKIKSPTEALFCAFKKSVAIGVGLFISLREFRATEKERSLAYERVEMEEQIMSFDCAKDAFDCGHTMTRKSWKDSERILVDRLLTKDDREAMDWMAVQ